MPRCARGGSGTRGDVAREKLAVVPLARLFGSISIFLSICRSTPQPADSRPRGEGNWQADSAVGEPFSETPEGPTPMSDLLNSKTPVLVARIVAALLLLAVAAFGAFGFMATFEPPGSPALRVVYGAGSVVALVVAGRIAMGKR
jgi:hypothetical protein